MIYYITNGFGLFDQEIVEASIVHKLHDNSIDLWKEHAKADNIWMIETAKGEIEINNKSSWSLNHLPTNFEAFSRENYLIKDSSFRASLFITCWNFTATISLL